MKKFLLQLTVSFLPLFFLPSCILPEVEVEVEVEEVMTVVTHILNAFDETDALYNFVYNFDGYGYYSADGSYAWVDWDTQTFSDYSPISSDYVVNGVLNNIELEFDIFPASTKGTLNLSGFYGSATLTIETTGTLDLSGGEVTILTFAITAVADADTGRHISTTIAGTVTANGTEFNVTDWGLGDLVTTQMGILFSQYGV